MTSASPAVPSTHADLLGRPLFGTLATVRPDGGPQASMMWFDWDGERARFTHTTTRQKYRNLRHEPRVSFTIQDPDDPYRYLEMRGVVTAIEPDPGAEFFQHMQRRYGMPIWTGDADVRVVVTVEPTSFVAVAGGLTAQERARP
jgi:PPOX class probable F420-dependent enzyme